MEETKLMTDLENYSNLINNIFGAETTTFDVSKKYTNRVIGALNHSQFSSFKKNFIARLKRLKRIYSSHPDFLQEIIVQINEIQSEKNWEGAFAELVTYDHLTSTKELFEPIKPNVTLPSNVSFAEESGKKETNLDGLIQDLSIYFDVKCLKDNNDEILQGIYNDLKKHLKYQNVHFLAEYAMDISYSDLQRKRSALLKELKEKITVEDKITSLKSSVITNLNFRITWDGGVSTGVLTYDPYLHAKNFHKSIFNYTNKFMKNKPTLIILVVFPWYNLVVNNHWGSNIEFYRSMSRRFFCQYKHSNVKMNTFKSKFKGNQTLDKISNYLSGIIILEDNTILSDDSDNTNVKAFSFFNPNAKNPISHSMAKYYIHQFTNERFDDFKNDNY